MPEVIEANNQVDFSGKLSEFLQAHRIHLSANQLRYLRVKRVTDVLISGLALLILFIPMGLVVVAQKISSPHEPAVFRQQRVGRGGKLFTMYKFRTMKTTAPQYASTKEFADAEQYISKLGHILRSTSIDELPQLYNVLKGDMSLIGPRPLIPQEDEVHYLRAYYGVDQLRPGITGWAQVNGRDLLDDYGKVSSIRKSMETACIHCNLCEKVCPILQSSREPKDKTPTAYAAINRDDGIRCRQEICANLFADSG